MLYEVVMIEKEKKDKSGEVVEEERLVFGPVCVLSKEPQDAMIEACMNHSELVNKVDKSRRSILVRPFA